ncbi:unnamed protein product [Cuscuta epithymum]|uniref:Uncharacterized protein n=1 Tax=Cuscuta epithymum TaxID=186058 RepID=A0AAV0EQE0_9ASTE|nr:unnamed protein product [Cuscuta epithymum]
MAEVYNNLKQAASCTIILAFVFSFGFQTAVGSRALTYAPNEKGSAASPAVPLGDDSTWTTLGHSPGIGHNTPPRASRAFDTFSHVDDFRPTDPGHSPGAGHSTPPPASDAFAKFSHVDDFRPTDPGHSPGAGHSTPSLASDAFAKFSHVDDFRPTDPGHSPGAGHA